jgi:hypothetical protein
MGSSAYKLHSKPVANVSQVSIGLRLPRNLRLGSWLVRNIILYGSLRQLTLRIADEHHVGIGVPANHTQLAAIE